MALFLNGWDMVAAFVCSTLSGMGVGGGGLLMIYFTLVRQMDAKAAQGLNLASFAVCAGISLLRRPSRREYTPMPKSDWVRLLTLGLCGVLLGKAAFSVLSERYFRFAYGAFLCACGLFALLHRQKRET